MKVLFLAFNCKGLIVSLKCKIHDISECQLPDQLRNSK